MIIGDLMNVQGLGRQIKSARNDRRLTAEQLSELCHINSVYLRQIESGMKTPSLPVFVDICNALRISPDYLLQNDLSTNEVSQIKEIEALWETVSPNTQNLALTILKTVLEQEKSQP